MKTSKFVSNHAVSQQQILLLFQEVGLECAVNVMTLKIRRQKLKQCHVMSGEVAACKMGTTFAKGHKGAAAG